MVKIKSLILYKIIREKWTHEDHLINYRISWLLVSQALFFAAYGVFSNVVPDPKWNAKAAKLIVSIPILGITISILAGISIIAAIVAQRSLSKYTFDFKGLSTPFGINTLSSVDMMGHSPAALLPLFFLIAWIVVLVA